MEYKKQILENYGYATHALTDGDGKIYGLNKECFISKFGWKEEIDKGKSFYWSDVYVTGPITVLIRKGMALVGESKTPERLNEYFEQSKVNLND